MNLMNFYLEIWDLCKQYSTPRGPAVIVKDFNFRMKQGEFVCLIGHSGCGKSTILSIIAGLTSSTSGAIGLAGRELDEAGPDRGVVFQSPCLLPWLTALDNVLLGVAQVQPKLSGTRRRAIAVNYLELVGLRDSLHKKPAELSQGMQQRVGIARAFALSPKMLLLDEPFGMLDSLTRIELQQALVELWRQEKKTALMVTHDVDEALFLADRIAMMTSGPAATLGGVLEVPFPHPRDRTQVLEHPDYFALREQLIGFLEDQAQSPAAGSPTPKSAPAPDPAAAAAN